MPALARGPARETILMKVHGSDPLARLKDLLTRAKETGAHEAGRSGRGAAAGGPGEADSVQISGTVQELQRLREAIADNPDVRERLVEELRDEIASGRYHVDGTRVADALLHEETLLAAAEGDGSGDV